MKVHPYQTIADQFCREFNLPAIQVVFLSKLSEPCAVGEFFYGLYYRMTEPEKCPPFFGTREYMIELLHYSTPCTLIHELAHHLQYTQLKRKPEWLTHGRHFKRCEQEAKKWVIDFWHKSCMLKKHD